MEKEQIIKALECCTKGDCDNCPNDFGNCYSNLARDALALIKELTEDNERLNGHLNQLKHRYDICKQNAKTEKIDTVRKMQDRLKEYLDDFYNSGEDALLDVPDSIDQIAKEMLEDEDDG